VGKLTKLPDAMRPIVLGSYTLHSTGITIKGRPTFDEHAGVGEFVQRAHKASGWWVIDWMRYGESRADWTDRLSQVVDATGVSEKRAKNLRAVGAIEPSRRRDDVELYVHEEVAGLEPNEQTHWLAQAADQKWDRRELRLNIRAARKRKVLEGQAVLEGMFRVVYADPPWLYGDRPPSGSGAQQHYGGMTIEQLCKLPVAAHALPDSVLFMWTTAPFILLNPGPREVIEAWGFTYKTQRIWDKVLHGFGHYVDVRHEILLICTRGSCTPDRPTPMLPSVVTERRSNTHSEKPQSFRKDIERLYDGPYLELFGRDRVDGWTVFGDDARLWAQEASA
jgi:N6-adenosine-specific RNA methylase IME4